MKLFRYYNENHNIRPGVAIDNVHCDVTEFGKDYDEAFFGTGGLERLRTWFDPEHCPTLPDEDIEFAPATCRPSKIICIGLNYSDHAAESGMEVPAEPVVFFKSTSSFCAPDDDLVIPRNSQKTDWEVELAFVIGKKASYVDEENAMDHVAGYALHNDYSEREFQIERCGQWVKGKSADTFAPFGPYVVTPDEVPDPHNLPLWLSLNGEKVQNGNTSTMVFQIPFLVHYLSQFMTLLPGDIVSTGTPPGVGLGMDPPKYIQPGDVIELGIDGLGEQRQVARAWDPEQDLD